MNKLFLLALLLFSGINLNCKHDSSKKETTSKLKNLVTLPSKYNTPDGAAMGPDGKLYISVPNFNNSYLLENKIISQPEPSYIITLSNENKITQWYEFKDTDLHPETGFVGPMDLAFGPDGNLYIADMQIGYNPMHKSRLVRINIENGKPAGMDVLVEGFIACNGMVWNGNTLFVTESILAHTPQDEIEPMLHSGVYAFNIEDFTEIPIKLNPFNPQEPSPYLAIHFETSGSGFGADGITFDDNGYLYTTVAGAIYKTLLDVANHELETTLFAQDKTKMISADGIIWNPKDRKLYTAGFLENALYSIDETGTIETLHQNGDTDGSNGLLDQPAEVILRNNELVIINMDLGAYSPDDVNTKPDEPYTISSYDLSDISKKTNKKEDRTLSKDLYTMLVTVKSKEGYENEIKNALIQDVEGANKENGNILIQLYQDNNTANTFYLYEKWENRNALLEHFKMPYTQQAFEAGKKYGAGVDFKYLKPVLPVSEKNLKVPKINTKSYDIFIEFTVKEDKKDLFIKHIQKSINNSRNEPGNLVFQFYEFVNSPNKFILHERWQDQNTMNSHLEKSYTKELLQILPEVLAIPIRKGTNYTEAYKQVTEISPVNREQN